MANAKPSSPGRATLETGGRMEINVEVGEEIVKQPDGRVVKRTEFNTGTIRETEVFPGDYPDAKPQKESK